ncbi:hypothetical protein F2Q70_00029104 [Brassica cretica]|uniref:Uncharacterized protein n=1 Tax=Brassica cretica TaxID=69181 RepID=A0A8S9FLW4_BRACR|nr:hypothetical protein F2Q70_00029104 [Brassica cretica]
MLVFPFYVCGRMWPLFLGNVWAYFGRFYCLSGLAVGGFETFTALRGFIYMIDHISASIDRLRGPWIDGKKPVELLPCTAAKVDKNTSKIYTTLDTMEERLDKRCDDIYFSFDNKISGLDSHAEWLQKEVKAIQRSALTTFKKGYRTSPMYLRRWMTNGQEMMRPQEVSLHLGPESGGFLSVFGGRSESRMRSLTSVTSESSPTSSFAAILAPKTLQ